MPTTTSTGSHAPVLDELLGAGASVGAAGVVSGTDGVPVPLGVVPPPVEGTDDAVGGGRVVTVAPEASASEGSALPPGTLLGCVRLSGVGSNMCVHPRPLR